MPLISPEILPLSITLITLKQSTGIYAGIPPGARNYKENLKKETANILKGIFLHMKLHLSRF